MKPMGILIKSEKSEDEIRDKFSNLINFFDIKIDINAMETTKDKIQQHLWYLDRVDIIVIDFERDLSSVNKYLIEYVIIMTYAASRDKIVLTVTDDSFLKDNEWIKYFSYKNFDDLNLVVDYIQNTLIKLRT